MSSHGEYVSSGSSNSGVWKIRSAHIICVHVVPHLAGVEITMSDGRSVKRSQRALSEINHV